MRCRVQNTGYKDAQELSKDINSIKKIQSEMKDTLVEIKKNLEGNNSKVNEAKNQINDLEHKEEINIQPEKKGETRISTTTKKPQNMRIV